MKLLIEILKHIGWGALILSGSIAVLFLVCAMAAGLTNDDYNTERWFVWLGRVTLAIAICLLIGYMVRP